MHESRGWCDHHAHGSLEPSTDLNIKRLIDKGAMPRPKMDVTGPYIEGPGSFSIQMPLLESADQASRLVDYWAAEGVTSFKAYLNISHDALGAAIAAAHKHHLKAQTARMRATMREETLRSTFGGGLTPRPSCACSLKVARHLCSVGFTEAAELGVDNLEHGLVAEPNLLPVSNQTSAPRVALSQSWH